MKLNLVIADLRSEILNAWRTAFSAIEGVTFLELSIPKLISLPQLDAVFMMNMFSHEKYGGKLVYGVSQVLSTRNEPKTPPWVVTTPLFPGHLEKSLKSDGSLAYKIKPNQKNTPEEQTYIIFREAFKSIKKFNKDRKIQQIKTLGIHLDFLDFPLGDPYKEAESAAQAYTDFSENINRN
ncbi:hypothetical protein [Synechococcus sp. PCC 7336]|uniref:hypothetical protein n=1 Tax=Synechococcus sp. PCC 7336 TaxID=195250 RepID=UPI00036F35F5|nr:hypothetical protein [Synechococcus sp. PCC 7336]